MLLIVGAGAFIQGLLRLGEPAQPIEKTGWLYKQFGDQGIAWGMVFIGIIAFVIGVIMFNSTWIRAIKERRLR